MPATSTSHELPAKFAYHAYFTGGELAGREFWYPIKRNKEVRPEIIFKEWCPRTTTSLEHWKEHRYVLDSYNTIPHKPDQIFIYNYKE